MQMKFIIIIIIVFLFLFARITSASKEVKKIFVLETILSCMRNGSDTRKKNQRICHKYYHSLFSNIDSIYSAHRRNDLTVFIKYGDIAQALLCAISSTMFKNNWVKLRPWNRFVHFGFRSAKSKQRQQQQPKLNQSKPRVIMYMRCERKRAEFLRVFTRTNVTWHRSTVSMISVRLCQICVVGHTYRMSKVNGLSKTADPETCFKENALLSNGATHEADK